MDEKQDDEGTTLGEHEVPTFGEHENLNNSGHEGEVTLEKMRSQVRKISILFKLRKKIWSKRQ